MTVSIFSISTTVWITISWPKDHIYLPTLGIHWEEVLYIFIMIHSKQQGLIHIWIDSHYPRVKWIIFISPIWVIKQTHDPIVSDPRLKFEAQKAGLIKQRRVVALSCTYERRSNSWSVCIVHPQLRWLYLRHLPFWWPRLSNFFLDLIEEETIYIFLVKHFKTSRHMKWS